MDGRHVDVSVGELPQASPLRGYGYGWSVTATGTYSDDDWLGCFEQTRCFGTRKEAEEWVSEELVESER